ncbi:RAM signaling network component [Mortierella polycephala]|uniref:RAM signaling network component n=1 Tax=Mortierella polycephala TaxID=41804 RepID=A0A9P6PV76_9FUNG|nr:RAM signaling network component [Mortierella polycephala]
MSQDDDGAGGDVAAARAASAAAASTAAITSTATTSTPSTIASTATSSLVTPAATPTTTTTSGSGGHGHGRRERGNSGANSLMELIRERQRADGSTTILDLSYANLDTFPSEIEFLRDYLEKLTMSHNSIKTLPLQLNMFRSLRYLNIRANSIKIFPAVLCHLSSLEILDMSRNKISRFPETFGNLMNLRVLSISKNRIETIPLYIGDMSQLQFLKIELNPIVFPPPEIVDNSGQDMESWLNRLKAFLRSHQRERDIQQPGRMRIEEARNVMEEGAPIIQQRANRSTSAESIMPPSAHRQSRSDSSLRLCIPNGVDRTEQRPETHSPDTAMHRLARTSSQHGEDHYRFISHTRDISGDSNSSFSSNTSNDCEKYSEIYFQRLATYPPPPHALPAERVRLVEAARGILFALSQIYRAIKQVIGCSTDEKFCLMFTRLMQSTNSAMAQLIQTLDRFDSSAQVQIPDQALCSEIMRCCESNVMAFRKLVHMVQTQLRNISRFADARLVRNLVLILHGALLEIRVAWDSLLPLLQGSGEVNVEIMESGQFVIKDQQQQQQLQQQHLLSSSSVATSNQHHHQHQTSANSSNGHQPHPLQLSPTMPATSTWPAQVPHRSQNMSRASNHSSQSAGNMQHDDDEDTQLLLTVEHAIEAARRLIQCLQETCISRTDSFAGSPQQRPIYRSRSVSASPPRSISSSGGSEGSGSTGGKNALQDQQGRSMSMSPLQLATDTSSSSAVPPSSTASSVNTKLTHVNLIRTPLFSSATDTVPYSNGMCLSLSIDQPAGTSSAAANITTTAMTTTTTTTGETTMIATATSTLAGQGEDTVPRYEKRAGSHSKKPSRTMIDPVLPSIPQEEANGNSPRDPSASATSTPQFQPIMTARSASVSGLPSNSHHGISTGYAPSSLASSLPSQGLIGPSSVYPYNYSGGQQQPMTPGLYSGLHSSFPLPSSGGSTPVSASHLWREMKDCLLQMTEIVKRLDLDLTMIRTDDYAYLQHHQHHSSYPQQHHHQHYGQYSFHHHIPHPHQLQQQQQQQQQHGHGSHQQHGVVGSDDTNILRRRFGMGVSDFVKSVVVISTLVRQLSSTSSSSNAARSNGSVSTPTLTGEVTSKVAASSTAIVTATSSGVPAASPTAPRARSGSGVDIPSFTTPTSVSASSTVNATDLSLGSNVGPPLPASLEKSQRSQAGQAGQAGQQSQQAQSQNQHQHQHHNHLPRNPQQPQQQLSQQQPEIFSRLVMTNVSNLTKITKELTVRMPRSSFRDYLLSSSSSSTNLISNASAGGGVGGSGSNHGTYGYGYGPVGASILAMRKSSLI